MHIFEKRRRLSAARACPAVLAGSIRLSRRVHCTAAGRDVVQICNIVTWHRALSWLSVLSAYCHRRVYTMCRPTVTAECIQCVGSPLRTVRLCCPVSVLLHSHLEDRPSLPHIRIEQSPEQLPGVDHARAQSQPQHQLEGAVSGRRPCENEASTNALCVVSYPSPHA